MSVTELSEFDASTHGGEQLVRGENGEEDSEDSKDLEGWVAEVRPKALRFGALNSCSFSDAGS